MVNRLHLFGRMLRFEKQENEEEMVGVISKCGIYTSQGKRVLLATRAVVNGRKAVAYVKNGQLQDMSIWMILTNSVILVHT